MGLVAVAIVIAVAPVGSRSGHFWVFLPTIEAWRKNLCRLPRSCTPAADVCKVPKGQCATVTGDKHCHHVEVRGTLTIKSHSKLHTSLLKVYEGGILQVGTEESPALDVELDLMHQGQLQSDGHVFVYGKPKTSWTTLFAECDHCKAISVKECKGWQEGDHIVLVGTGDGNNGQVQANSAYRTDERRIKAIERAITCLVTLDRSADQLHRSELYKGRVPINSEVLNMDRSVRITGSGIRTKQQHHGVMKMHYAQLSNCGAKIFGEYCLHFHHMKQCPTCSFKGNVITKSVNKAIVVHGTSGARVESNVVYDHRGAFLYVEDGNEIGNMIANNALVCPRKAPHCSLHDGVAEHKASDLLEQAGMYVVSASNDFIGNHISGMENAFFQDFQSGSKVWGNHNATGKVCPQALSWRRVEKNYFHNNQGFGFYAPHSSYPTRTRTDSNGHVSDWNSCLGFDPQTGEDNSQGYQVTDHVELFHNFGAGGYDGGETSFKNAIFAFGLSANYFKTFRRGKRSGPFCDGCYIVGAHHPMTPGGSCMWEYKDTTFEDSLYGLHVNHHCGNDGEWTGGLCASHVWFTGNAEWKGKFRLKNDGFHKSGHYTDTIVHYKGSTYFASSGAHPAFRTDDCVPRAFHSHHSYGHFTECKSDKIRIVRIYSANRGQLKVINTHDGHAIHVPYTPWTKSRHWGRPNAYDISTDYQNGGMGYTFLVKAGHSYVVQADKASTLPDLFTLEYSDIQMPRDSIKLDVQGDPLLSGHCTIESSHNRNWITPYGPYVPASGAWWHCRRWHVHYTVAQHRLAQHRHLSRHKKK